MLTGDTDMQLAFIRKKFFFLLPAGQQAKLKADDQRSVSAPESHQLSGSPLETNAFTLQLSTFIGAAESYISINAEVIHFGFWATSACRYFEWQWVNTLLLAALQAKFPLGIGRQLQPPLPGGVWGGEPSTFALCPVLGFLDKLNSLVSVIISSAPL